MSSESPISPEKKVQNIESVVAATPEVAGFQAYEYFRSDIVGQKEDFLSGAVDSLAPNYARLDARAFLPVAAETEHALASMLGGEESMKSEALYQAVQYRLGEMFMAKLAADLTSGSLASEERAETLRWFRQTNEALYGVPDSYVFSALARKHLPLDKPANGQDSDDAAVLRDELRGLLGQIRPTDYEPYVANNETVARIHDLVAERFEPIVGHIDPDATYDVPGMVDALQIALQKMGGDELGWKVAIAPDSTALAVSAHQKMVEVGEKRKSIKGSTLKGKVIHEEGIHALRSINAQKAGWLSAAYGQDGYLNFEESLATALEDAYEGKFADHGVDYYLIAGLAYGLDNHAPRDFREVYEIMWRAEILKTSGGSELSEEAVQKAKSKSFNGCVRLFRGTTTKDKGVVYLKDLAYFDGQERVWSVLDGMHTQEDFDLLLTGKLDLTRDDHLEIAKEIDKHSKQAA